MRFAVEGCAGVGDVLVLVLVLGLGLGFGLGLGDAVADDVGGSSVSEVLAGLGAGCAMAELANDVAAPTAKIRSKARLDWLAWRDMTLT